MEPQNEDLEDDVHTQTGDFEVPSMEFPGVPSIGGRYHMIP